jgi:hypothetical protein
LTGVSTTIFDTTTVTNMTITGTPVVNCTATTGTSVQTRIFIAGNHGEAQAISVNINPGTSAVDIFRFATNSGAFKDVTFSNTFTGTIQISNTVFFYGNVTFGGATAYTGNSTLTFAATSGTKTIRTSSLTIDAAITFNGVGGTWQLQDALTSGATRLCTLTNGTLDLNGYTLTTGQFSSSNTNTRTLAFGSTGKIVITANNATVCTTNTGTGLTITGSKRVELTYSGSTGTRTIQGATNATVIEGTNLLNYFVTAGSDIVAFSASRNYETVDFSNGGTSTFTGTWINATATTNVYGNLILNSAMVVGSGAEIISMKATSGTKTITSAGQTIDFPLTISGLGGTFACSDALTLGSTRALTLVNGTLQLAAGTTSTVGSFVTTGTTMKYLQSTIPGTQATISDASGTDSVTYLSVQDSNATGGAVWDATDLTNVDAGNNTGWRFSILAALSGLLATGSVGILIGTRPVSLSGTQATGAVGSFSFTSTIPMSGVAATGSITTIFGFGWGAIPDTSETWTNIS